MWNKDVNSVGTWKTISSRFPTPHLYPRGLEMPKPLREDLRNRREHVDCEYESDRKNIEFSDKYQYFSRYRYYSLRFRFILFNFVVDYTLYSLCAKYGGWLLWRHHYYIRRKSHKILDRLQPYNISMSK